jgi:hypothetical protein
VKARRIAVLLAFSFLFFEILRRQHPSDLPSRVKILERFGGSDLRTRRMAGTAAGYDRRFFEFLERARLSLPPGTAGVTLHAPGIPEWGGVYLGVYHLAPVPVDIAPKGLPQGWVAALYGVPPPPDGRVIVELPNGWLVGRP